MNFTTTIESNGKKLFTLITDGEGPIRWECYGSTSKSQHTSVLLELQRIGYLIGKMKTEIDAKRINDSEDPIIFG